MSLALSTEFDHVKRYDSLPISSPTKMTAKVVNVDVNDTLETKVYAYRWVVMASAALMQIVSMIFFIAYSPVASSMNTYYDNDANDLTSALYMAASAIFAIPSMYITQTYGLRPTMYIAATTNFLGAIIRVLAITTEDTTMRQVYLYVGTFIGGAANPFAINVPTRIAGVWFPDNQRALCTSIISTSGPAGIMVMSVLSPAIVKAPADIDTIHIIVVALSAACFVIVLATILWNEPALPPSLSQSTHEQPPFWQSLANCFKTAQFNVIFQLYLQPSQILLVVLGCGIGLFNVLYVQMEQILCLRGYTDTFSGYCIVAMIMSGVIGAAISGVISDKTKLFTEILKIAFPFIIITLCIFTIVVHYTDLEALIIITIGIFGVFGLAAYATSLELVAEITFPVIETTSAGLMGLAGQIAGIALIQMISMLGRAPRFEQMMVQTCTSAGAKRDTLQDSTNALIVLNAVGVALAVVGLSALHPTYKRMSFEQFRAKQEEKPQSSSSRDF